MDRARRFELEVRTVVVSWKAAVRSIKANGSGVDGVDQRALELLDGVVERYPEVADDEDRRRLLDRSRELIRSRQPD